MAGSFETTYPNITYRVKSSLFGGLMLMLEQTKFERLCDRIAATLEGAGITESDLQATLPEARRRVVARRYPRLLDTPAPKGKAKRR